MPRQKRRPGAQPGNRHAVTHGFYAKGMPDAQALELDEAQRLPTDDLSGEMGRLRLHLRDLIGNSPDRAELVSPRLRTPPRPAPPPRDPRGAPPPRAGPPCLTSQQSTTATPSPPP